MINFCKLANDVKVWAIKYKVTQKKVITKNRITSKILFRLTQNFSYIRSSLCSRYLQSFTSVLQKLFASLALKNVLQMNSLALQAYLDPAAGPD